MANVWDPSRIVIIFDHRIPAESEKTATTHKAVREFASAQGIENFYDVGRGGICHQVLPERGHVRPGMVLVGTDSHTTTHGAFGAFATGIGATEMSGVWTEGSLWFKVPSTIRVEVEGEFRPWVSAKDLILYVIGRLGAAGADYRAVEFDGSAIRAMTVASRMVLANLSMEMGAKVAFTPVDETLLAWLREHTPGPLESIAPDADAVYEKTIRINLETDVPEPQIACPHSVDNVKPLSALAGLPVHQGVLGSCTNGRLEDLEVAARIVAGGKVHKRTRLVVIPASQLVYREALRLGYLETPHGCRRHHQSARLRTLRRRAPGHPGGGRELRLLDQPQLHRAHGQQGLVRVPGQSRRGGRLGHRGRTGASSRHLQGECLMPGGEMILHGRVAAVLGDNIDTDIIYPGRYLNVTDREKTAEHLFELAYPDIRAALKPGELIVAAANFGCGSSREQAAAALKFAGVGAVIAASFARIFYRNSINLGLPAVVAPALAASCQAGDELVVDLASGTVTNLTRGDVVEAAALDPRAVELLAAGGLIPYLKRKYAA